MFTEVQKEKKYFIINMNSFEVSGALVYFDKQSQLPTIEYSVHEYMEMLKGDSATKFKESTMKSLKRTIDKLSNYVNISGGIEEIDKTFVFLAAPWVRKNIYNIVDERIQPFVISEEYLESFLENGGQIRGDEDLVKAQIISTKVNGYQSTVSELINKEATRLDVSLMDSYINAEDKEAIEETIKAIYPMLDIAYSAFLPVFFTQIKKLYDISDDFVFMDFTGEIMEFGVYQNEEIVHISSLQAGKNKILREMIDTNISTDLSDAEYTLSLFLQNNLDDEMHEKVSAVVKNNILAIRTEIKKDFEKYKNFHMPKKSFIVSGGEMNQILKDFDLTKETHFVGKSLIKNFATATEDIYFDNFLALEAEHIFEK